MNWKEISEKYPRAFGEFADRKLGHHYKCTNEVLYQNMGKYDQPTDPFNPRDLYDYFDGLEMYGTVDQIGGGEQWEFAVTDRRNYVIGTLPRQGADSYYYVSTRTAAESALFTRMFELRESQLLEGEAK